MRALISTLHAPKFGSGMDEYEDASAVDPAVRPDQLIKFGCIYLAVADGASESMLSKNWAQVLASETIRIAKVAPGVCQKRNDFAAAIRIASDRWDIWLDDYLTGREETLRPVRWYEKPGLDRGSHSTILVARIREPNDGAVGLWHACAIGDTCLFQVRGERLIDSFPAENSADFNSSPALVNSKNKDLEIWERNALFSSGSYEQGDQFFAGTDALAAWFLSAHEKGEKPWEILHHVSRKGNQEEFDAWVNQERQADRMRNDDVTVVHVALS